MQNNSSQPKNEKSTGRKTRPSLVEKMAMPEEIHAGVSRYVFVLAAASWSINQSINQYQRISIEIERGNVVFVLNTYEGGRPL